MEKRKKQEFKIECECGTNIVGFSEHHAKQNLKIHKTSKTHKQLMELKKKWLNENKSNSKSKHDNHR